MPHSREQFLKRKLSSVQPMSSLLFHKIWYTVNLCVWLAGALSQVKVCVLMQLKNELTAAVMSDCASVGRCEL